MIKSMNKEIRWRQRFQNFEKAEQQLKSAVQRVNELDELAKEGLVQRFEYSFELAWKTLKDYLESKGEEVKFTRDVLKKAFQFNLVKNGEVWLDMLEKRNLMSHTHNEEIFSEVVELIVNKYFQEIEDLYDFFKLEE